MNQLSKEQGAFDERVWCEHQGHTIVRYTLENAHGLRATLTNFGAIVTELYVPDRDGRFDDVVLGFDEFEPYLSGPPYMGAIVGRVAGRIANSEFVLEGHHYRLEANDAPHHLHGGPDGWYRVPWQGKGGLSDRGPQVTFTHVSPDGDAGYPGRVVAKVTYTLTHDDTLRVHMTASTDRVTLLNMVHHSYWNLAGHRAGSIEDHQLTLHAARYTPPDGLVPTGEVRDVRGTPYDFTRPKLIGRDLRAAGGDPVGYDHNWLVDGEPDRLRPVARLRHAGSGRVMVIEANQPAVQFYSGNMLDGTLQGKGGVRYGRHGGLSLETQRTPNAINVPEWSDQVIQHPDRKYEHVMIHRFSVD